MPVLHPPSSCRCADRAQALAQGGYALDVPIMVWNWDPVTTMGVRQSLGFTWVPSALQAPLNGAVGTGAPPAGLVRGSTNGGYYPPSDPPGQELQGKNVGGRQ